MARPHQLKKIKNLPLNIATALGHLDQESKNLQSTKIVKS